MDKAVKILGKILLFLTGIYALLFVVFWFDLDGKALFYGVEPLLVKHYDKMKRRDPMKKEYHI